MKSIYFYNYKHLKINDWNHAKKNYWNLFYIVIYMKHKDIFFGGSYWCKRRGHCRKNMDNFTRLCKFHCTNVKKKPKNERYKNILLIVKIKQHIELQNIHHMIQVFFLKTLSFFFYHSIWNVTRNIGHVEEITWRPGNPLVDFRLVVCDSHRQAMVLRAGPSVNNWQLILYEPLTFRF